MPTVHANNRTFFYREEGKGFPVLMTHSLLLDGEMFEPQARALKEKYRVIRLDLRGHGQSQKATEPFALEDYRDDILAVADALGLKRFHYVGLSQGGMAGMRLALKAPERLAGFVLMDTDADAEEPARRAQYEGFAKMARTAPPNPAMADMTLQMTFFRKAFLDANPEVAKHYQNKLLANDAESMFHATMAVITRGSILGEIPRIKLPTLIFVGEKDTGTTPEKARQINERIAGSELVVVPDAAHITTLEQPALVNEKLLTFFAGWEC